VNIWREIEDARAGFVEDDDLAGTIRLLTRWLQTSPEAWTEMKESALQCFTQCFKVEAAATSLLETLDSVLGSDEPDGPRHVLVKPSSHQASE
jgi:hypothetical protein